MEDTWSKTEKKAARRAFDTAYARETASIMDELRRKVREMKTPKDLWETEQFLRRRGDEIARRYDYRYSQLILVFAILYHQGFITKADLEDIRPEKIEQIMHCGGAFGRTD